MSDPKTIVRWVVWHPLRNNADIYESRWRAQQDAEAAGPAWRCTRIEEASDE